MSISEAKCSHKRSPCELRVSIPATDEVAACGYGRLCLSYVLSVAFAKRGEQFSAKEDGVGLRRPVPLAQITKFPQFIMGRCASVIARRCTAPATRVGLPAGSSGLTRRPGSDDLPAARRRS